MRPLYLLLKISLTFALRLFYRKRVVINQPIHSFGSTIYVCNHPNSFMDPLVIGYYNKAIVNFMVRSDVFKWWLKPVLWASHMLPIFRQQDGENTKEKNASTFRIVSRSLAKGRNILIFGEGFTDDIPVRTLKPIKKGAVRMGFGALDAIDWSKPIYVAGVGVNYTAKNTIGSDVIIENTQPICLNDYRRVYEENPNRVINEVNTLLEGMMQRCVTYISDPKSFDFHENIMRFTGKGMNHEHHNASDSLEKRLKYSQQLAIWLNAQHFSTNTELQELDKELNQFLNKTQYVKYIHQLKQQSIAAKFFLLWGIPFSILGLIHGLIPYTITKLFTENVFKRPVFWGSVKMMLGKFLGVIYNVFIICWLNANLFPSNWIGLGYFFILPLCCFIAYKHIKLIRFYVFTKRIKAPDDKEVLQMKDRISAIIPVA